jgi:hypothetical protein
VVGVPDRRTHKEIALMSSRPLAVLASLVLAVLGFVFLIPDCASACTCGSVGSQTQKESVESELSSSEAVFSGEVVDLKRNQKGPLGGVDKVSFRVSEVWKGSERKTLEVSTQAQGTACGYPFEEGQEYLVYAYGKQNLKASACSETKPFSEAGADLALLGNSEKPKDGGGEALSDTSGGVSARAIAGMAGLLMTASLLMVVRLVRTG